MNVNEIGKLLLSLRDANEHSMIVSFGAHKETDDTVTPYMSATVTAATNKGHVTETSAALDLETAIGMARAKLGATLAGIAKKEQEDKAAKEQDA